MTQRSFAANGASDRIRQVVDSLGTDKEGRPISIRSSDLAKRAGVALNSLYTLINPMVKRGEIYACSVKPATGHAYNEYRKGAGVPIPDFKPLNPARAGVALGKPGKPLPVTTPAPQMAPEMQRTAKEIEIPELRKAKPPTEAPSAEPARSQPREGSIRISIDQDGALQIGDDGDPARYLFNPAQTLAIGDFLVLTQGIWRP